MNIPTTIQKYRKTFKRYARKVIEPGRDMVRAHRTDVYVHPMNGIHVPASFIPDIKHTPSDVEFAERLLRSYSLATTHTFYSSISEKSVRFSGILLLRYLQSAKAVRKDTKPMWESAASVFRWPTHRPLYKQTSVLVFDGHQHPRQRHGTVGDGRHRRA
jgi:hypothetical protein